MGQLPQIYTTIIHDATTPSQWRHVDSASNPADIASRGIGGDETEKLQEWLYGPYFLLTPEENWPRGVSAYEIPEGDVELKKDVAVNAVVTEHGLNKMIEHFSDWTKLIRGVAWLSRFKVYCVNKFLNRNAIVKKGELIVDDIRAAERTLITYVQSRYFLEEIEDLGAKRNVKRDSKLVSLNPIIENGLIRMQGRRQSTDPKHYPMIIPQSDHLSTLIIRHIHEAHGHVGREQVLAIVRKKYWILRGPSAVKRVLKGCITCKRLHGPLLRQQMAPLLEEQMTPNKPPFTYVGIDYFGPLLVKTQDTTTKRYGCLFTCLATRAVHLEVANTLTADSFLAAFQRFVSRRGMPEVVHSDNGRNLVSGDRELKRCLSDWNHSKIGRHMVKREIEWHFNPPSASHMGGLWERLLRSTRTILKSLIKEQLLNDEQLLTLMTETENILNSRPITHVSRDPDDPLPLTPNMLLMMKSETHIPYRICENENSPTRKLWRQIQYLVNVFWRRWVREYLPTLQRRQKWQRSTRDLRVGDVVLLAHEKVSRGQWPLGVVEDVKTGRDGHVRSCVVKTKDSKAVKPITKLCLLEGSN